MTDTEKTTPPAPCGDEDRVSTSDVLNHDFSESEIVIGFVGAVGADLESVIRVVEERLRTFKYDAHQIRISRDVIPLLSDCSTVTVAEHERIAMLMDAGNAARGKSKDNSVLALGAAARIAAIRPQDTSAQEPMPQPRRAYLLNSLKHPDEVARLRQIYPNGFYLIGVHADPRRRLRLLTEVKRIKPADAELLMNRDEDEHVPHGQRTSDTFHLSDFFVRLDENHDKLQQSIWRVLDILFGRPHVTPTFDEYAMFMAFSASLRSADLSRQVGAVVAKCREIVATGANDCPKAGGGLYWPEYDDSSSSIVDAENGRDYMRGEDANQAEQMKIIEEILSSASNLC